MTKEKLIEFARSNLTGIQARDVAIEVCGPQTGHTVRPVAFCKSPQIAAALVAAVEAALIGDAS